MLGKKVIGGREGEVDRRGIKKKRKKEVRNWIGRGAGVSVAWLRKKFDATCVVVKIPGERS